MIREAACHGETHATAIPNVADGARALRTRTRPCLAPERHGSGDEPEPSCVPGRDTQRTRERRNERRPPVWGAYSSLALAGLLRDRRPAAPRRCESGRQAPGLSEMWFAGVHGDEVPEAAPASGASPPQPPARVRSTGGAGRSAERTDLQMTAGRFEY